MKMDDIEVGGIYAYHSDTTMTAYPARVVKKGIRREVWNGYDYVEAARVDGVEIDILTEDLSHAWRHETVPCSKLKSTWDDYLAWQARHRQAQEQARKAAEAIFQELAAVVETANDRLGFDGFVLSERYGLPVSDPQICCAKPAEVAEWIIRQEEA